MCSRLHHTEGQEASFLRCHRLRKVIVLKNRWTKDTLTKGYFLYSLPLLLAHTPIVESWQNELIFPPYIAECVSLECRMSSAVFSYIMICNEHTFY